MPKLNTNLIVIITCLLLVLAGGFYVTIMRQGQELERLRKAEKVAKMKRTEVSSLLAEYASTKAQAEEVVRKWRSRYKVIPETLSTPQVMGYLNDLSREGFKTFDVAFVSEQQTPDFRMHTMRVSGRGYFSSLYRFIWEIENKNTFYDVNDLTLTHIDLLTTNEETGRERLQVMVSFGMQVNAIFDGPEGTSEPGDVWKLTSADGEVGTATARALPPVPRSVLVDDRPDVNPFFPIIMENLPPNTYDLLEIEEADFVSIAGGKAVFIEDEGVRRVGVGDPVYLGQITEVDPLTGTVTARLNKGGIIDEVVIELLTGDHYRQAIGPARLRPSTYR